ncbi:peptide deformylase [uncultured Paludibaculum sp.]|uniref:peptide deformylase n=1 Tax=uncultured Paludibaculum sp. TaxID=1765020 RepID=UPI002AAAC0C7|nr:peptide deformylase [uncultured Paludibaculum sp.]
MPVRRILQLGDPLLRAVSSPVDPSLAIAVLQDLDDTLVEFRRTHGFGRGISAIQIGAAVRVVFLRVDGIRYELINPEYTWRSPEMFELWDDCFSFPQLMVRLRRHQSVGIRYQSRDGVGHDLTAEGALSELLQHEIDHLDGVLAVDRAQGPNPLATREEWLRQHQA